ncbi:SpoIIIAH-like family protein [Paenibacillus sp. HB172176]|uniref:SpoIIIAH-like family protein n=1 Tax=Paenibacillus sp. HB172176 TaxID=2493690 RepID=UPI00143ADF87|nr:SpoIIIAH-like family protein [Paenibacillus sp. HB172176]
MNTKRQTIWLVSMLSLMVVLSAYYLFTQDLNDPDQLSGNVQPGQDVTEVADNDNQVVVDEVDAKDGEAISVLNQQILDKLKKEGFASGGLFSELLAKRDQQYADAENKIMATIADVSTDTEASTAAAAEYDALQDNYSKITNLEEQLMQTYEIALIDKSNDNYKVVVTSDSLEKKDAASIIDQVITVMEVKPSQVSVQFVPAP